MTTKTNNPAIAEAKRITVKEEVVTTVVTDVPMIQLTLTLEQAQTLADVYGKTGGCPTGSRRKHIQAIGSALAKAGVHFQSVNDLNGVSFLTPAEAERAARSRNRF